MKAVPREVQILIERAAGAQRAGRLMEAHRLLEEALRAAPRNPVALNSAGMIALLRGEHAVAAERFAAAGREDPDEPALWMNLATAERGIGNRAAEDSALRRVLALDPHHLMAHLRLAQLLQRTGDDRGAVGEWRTVLQLCTTIDTVPTALADELRIGQAFLKERSASLARRLDDRFGSVAGDADGMRIRACIDHVVGRRAIFANACAGVQFPFLPAYEFFDRRLFEWLPDLEAETAAIRAEAMQFLQAPDAVRPYVRLEPNLPANKWSPLDGSLDWGASFLWEYGRPNDAVLRRCPATAEALARVPQTNIPARAPTAFFSMLKPRTKIPPHTGVTNARTIVHLPLLVPEDCGFRVGGSTRPWIEGEAFAFDDTIEHEAWNDSDLPRIVLIFDVWNPYLTATERGFLADFFDEVDQGSAPFSAEKV